MGRMSVQILKRPDFSSSCPARTPHVSIPLEVFFTAYLQCTAHSWNSGRLLHLHPSLPARIVNTRRQIAESSDSESASKDRETSRHFLRSSLVRCQCKHGQHGPVGGHRSSWQAFSHCLSCRSIDGPSTAPSNGLIHRSKSNAGICSWNARQHCPDQDTDIARGCERQGRKVHRQGMALWNHEICIAMQ